ncbi:patatin-like phospholipase family protein [Candidatus Peregrinibacteria bacterium]|nr:patatin-like phospholipase family protein [Candidatus Peregrinibacteria bacterium]
MHRKPLGIVLGGGGARCFTHVGILEELTRSGIRPARIVGSSTGSIIAALAGFGVPTNDILREFLSPLTRAKWYMPNGFFTFSQQVVRDILARLIGPAARIEHAQIPLMIVATDIRSGNMVVLERGNLADAVCASSCHPAIHKPVRMQGREFADGGILDNVPADICRTAMGKRGIVFTSSLDSSMRSQGQCTGHFPFLFRSIYLPLLHARFETAHTYSDLVSQPFRRQLFCFHNWSNIMSFGSSRGLRHFYECGRREGKKMSVKLLRLLA